MSDNHKKSGPGGGGGGARDISDLKAKLGLKKGAGGAGAVPPPTGGGVPSPVPSPSGESEGEAAAAPTEAAHTAHAADPGHDLSRDPFATGAPAGGFYGYGPIPGMDDGKPVEQINKPQPWGRLAIMGGTVLVLFVAGFTLGKIQWARANMNHTIDQAADISAEVTRMSKILTQINERVLQSADAAKNNPDVQLAADLASLDLKKPETDKIFKTNYYYLDDLSVDLLFNYYNDTILLYNLINVHGKKTEADKDGIENFVKNQKAGSEKNFGVTLDASGAIMLAHLAEVGSPVCPKEGVIDCPANELKGFKFRTDSGGQWFDRPVKGAPDKIIVPLQKSPLSTAVMGGDPNLIAVKEHVRRMNDIRGISAKLFNEQKELLSKLELASDKKRKVNEYLIF